MKLAFLGLFLLVLSISAIPTEPESSEFSKIDLGYNPNVTPQQKECMKNVYNQIKREHPELAGWFAKVDESERQIESEAEKCKQKPTQGDKQICLHMVKVNADKEMARLINLLPPNQKPIINKIKAALEQCVKH